MAEHNLLGKRGEDIAANYLIKQGYLILERSWTFQHLELDIIALKDEMLIIIEVKTRSSAAYADPDDTISKKKLRQIYDCTERYMAVKNITWEVRYDLITVIDNGEHFSVDYIEDAFYPFVS